MATPSASPTKISERPKASGFSAIAPIAAAPRVLFRASHYDVRASLDTFGQAISAQAKVEFTANQPSRLIEVELNENLRVTAVTDASGKPLLFDRDENIPLRIQVTLPDAVPADVRNERRRRARAKALKQ